MIDFSEIKKLYLKTSIFSSNSFSLSSRTAGHFVEGTSLALAQTQASFQKLSWRSLSFVFFEATYSAKIREIVMK